MLQLSALRLVLPIALISFFPLIYSLPHTPRDTNVPLRILPLGDSITFGWQSNHRDGTNGYRAQLLADLSAAGYKVDFVGTQHSGNMTDNDNEGHSGFTISQIQNVMADGLAMEPNVVLLHAGTNDLGRPETDKEKWADAPNRLGELLDDVFEVVPDAVVLVAKIIPSKNTQTQTNIQRFNAAIPDVARQQIQDGFKVAVVDQSVVGVKELGDGVHPTDAGYAHMGDIWFEGIKTVGEKGLITAPA